MKALSLLICLIAVASADVLQNCPSCSSSCDAPLQGGVCENGEWTYKSSISLSGSTVLCPVRAQGDVTIVGSLVTNLCGKVTASGTLNFDQVSLGFDFMETGATPGQKVVFATGKSVKGSIGYSRFARLQSGSQNLFFVGIEDNKATVAVAAPGSPNPFPPPPAPGFDANGLKLNTCEQLKCTNNGCADLKNFGAVCDTASGEWVFTGAFSLQTPVLFCPVRIEGSLSIGKSLTVSACAKIKVNGVVTLGKENDSPTLTVDLDGLGASYNVNDKFEFLSGKSLVGSFGYTSFRNLWGKNGVKVDTQKCNNAYTMIAHTPEKAPPRDCNPPPFTFPPLSAPTLPPPPPPPVNVFSAMADETASLAAEDPNTTQGTPFYVWVLIGIGSLCILLLIGVQVLILKIKSRRIASEVA